MIQTIAHAVQMEIVQVDNKDNHAIRMHQNTTHSTPHVYLSLEVSIGCNAVNGSMVKLIYHGKR